MFETLFNESKRAADQSLYDDEMFADFNSYRNQFSRVSYFSNM